MKVAERRDAAGGGSSSKEVSALVRGWWCYVSLLSSTRCSMV